MGKFKLTPCGEMKHVSETKHYKTLVMRQSPVLSVCVRFCEHTCKTEGCR